MVNCLFLLALTLIFSPNSFGQAADCATAQTVCQSKCGNLPIYDYDKGDYLKQSDFPKNCEHSCTEGDNACNVQDSKNSCDTFYYRCATTCSWTVNDTSGGTQVPVPRSNAFYQCMEACSDGDKSCKPVSQKLPKRKRTGKFNECEEGQRACYAWCMKPKGSGNLPANFPDLCARACATGVSPCQAAADKTAKCNEFLWKCQDACPDVKHDIANNVYTETSAGRKCLNSCYEGNLYCFNILNP